MLKAQVHPPDSFPILPYQHAKRGGVIMKYPHKLSGSAVLQENATHKTGLVLRMSETLSKDKGKFCTSAAHLKTIHPNSHFRGHSVLERISRDPVGSLHKNGKSIDSEIET